MTFRDEKMTKTIFFLSELPSFILGGIRWIRIRYYLFDFTNYFRYCKTKLTNFLVELLVLNLYLFEGSRTLGRTNDLYPSLPIALLLTLTVLLLIIGTNGEIALGQGTVSMCCT